MYSNAALVGGLSKALKFPMGAPSAKASATIGGASFSPCEPLLGQAGGGGSNAPLIDHQRCCA